MTREHSFNFRSLALFMAVLFISWSISAQSSSTSRSSKSDRTAANENAAIGAYYFDGWTRDQLRWRITASLKAKFAGRQPIWGWTDDTVEVMRKQIDYCADGGLAFLAFDWYYPKTVSLNSALGLYLKAENRERLKFCLLVANEKKRPICPSNWNECCQIWVDLFNQPTYLRVNGQPLLIFFSPKELEKSFGDADAVRKAFEVLRAKAEKSNSNGVAIAACTSPDDDWNNLVRSGYTLLTGYNYHNCSGNGINHAGPHPFASLIENSRSIFAEFAERSPLPYIPAITTGWDRRPWESELRPASRSPWYPDRTPEDVEKFVRMGIRWMYDNPGKTTKEKVLLLYAWNENGEGGYLTPTDADGTAYLEAIQRAASAPAPGN